MAEITTIGLDLAKHVFQVHGVDGAECVVVRKRLRRADVLAFFEQLSPCLVAMEACAGAHHWARQLQDFGHDVRLIPPSRVKPFVGRQKNDAADAAFVAPLVERPRGFQPEHRCSLIHVEEPVGRLVACLVQAATNSGVVRLVARADPQTATRPRTRHTAGSLTQAP